MARFAFGAGRGAWAEADAVGVDGRELAAISLAMPAPVAATRIKSGTRKKAMGDCRKSGGADGT